MKPLEEYRKKRRFGRTPEPPPKRKASRAGNLFVVQKHRATQLHYDFRLEVDQVLKPWSVPKGPALDPSIKRFAIAVEDHPLDYADFEGVIPADEYGSGTVMVWDRGTYEPEYRRRRRPASRAAQAHVEGPEAQGVVGPRANQRAPLAPLQASRPLRLVEGHRPGGAAFGAERPDAGADRGRRGGRRGEGCHWGSPEA